MFIFSAEYYLLSTRNSIKTFKVKTFKQLMQQSLSENISRTKRFSVGVKTILKLGFYRFVTRNVLAKHLLFFSANDIICYGDEDHNARLHLCQKKAGNSLFFGNCAKIRYNYSLSRYLNNSQHHRIPLFTDI